MFLEKNLIYCFVSGKNSRRREKFAHYSSLSFLPSWAHVGKLDSWQCSHGSSAEILTDMVLWIIILVSITQNNVISSMPLLYCHPPCYAFWRGKSPVEGANVAMNIFLSTYLIVFQRMFVRYVILILLSL